ncbi:hypothetical protein [Streptomyces sp. NPDC006285]
MATHIVLQHAHLAQVLGSKKPDVGVGDHGLATVAAEARWR